MGDLRIAWKLLDGTISTVNPIRKGGEAKAGHVLEQAGAVKIGEGSREKSGLFNTPDFKVANRSLRNAWRVDSLTGKLFINFDVAKDVLMDRMVSEGAELKRFIEDKLKPKATMRGDTAGVALLNAALGKIKGVYASMPGEFARMTDPVDVAAFKPNWPQLTSA